MFSSDPGRRFVLTALASAAALTLAAFAAAALLDPFGMVAATTPLQGPCAPGVKVMDETAVRPALAAVHQPTDILVGSSRTVRGFDAQGAALLGGQAVNLGLTGADLDAIDAMARRAVEDAPVRRVWIGLDFGGAALPAGTPDLGPVATGSPRETALRRGLASPQALKAALAVRPSTCAAPPYDAGGFLRAPPATPFHPIDAATRGRLLQAWRMPEARREALYAHRMQRLRRLVEDLEGRGIQPILYRTPSHPAYDALVEEAGLTPLYARWRADVAELAAGTGTVLVEADAPGFVDGATLPECAGPRIDCAFADAVHFRPEVGAAILREGLSRASRRSPTDARRRTPPGS